MGISRIKLVFESVRLANTKKKGRQYFLRAHVRNQLEKIMETRTLAMTMAVGTFICAKWMRHATPVVPARCAPARQWICSRRGGERGDEYDRNHECNEEV